jgi:hypothetical protein
MSELGEFKELAFWDPESQMPCEESSYILSGSGFSWFYSDTKKTMVRIMRGAECILYEKDPGSESKYIVQVGNEILSIPEAELVEIGWN